MESVKSLDGKFGDIKIGTSFLDLPDEMIERIFFHLDLVARCKMRGMSRRMYGIDDRVERSLENRSKLIIYDWGTSVSMRMIRDSRANPGSQGVKSDDFSPDKSISHLHRLLEIFNFEHIKVTTNSKELLNVFDGIRTGFIEIPPLLLVNRDDDISSHFNRSTICNLMQNSDIVNINRICKNLNVDDLKHMYETAKNNENFCGIAFGASRALLSQFVKDFELDDETEDYFSGRSLFVWVKREEQMEIRVMIVDQNSCRSPNELSNQMSKFFIYNFDSEEKYPNIPDDLFVNYAFYCKDQYDDLNYEGVSGTNFDG